MYALTRRNLLEKQIPTRSAALAAASATAFTADSGPPEESLGASTDPLSGYRVNRVKALIYLWYALFEIHTRQVHDRILALCQQPFLLNMGPTTIRTPDEFRAWYQSLFGTISHSLHDISRIDVRLSSATAAEAQIQYVHRFRTTTGQTAEVKYGARMQVVEHSLDTGPLVVFYEPLPLPLPT